MRPVEPKRRRKTSDIHQQSWRQLRNPMPRGRLISDDEVQRIDDAARRMLQEIGVRCLSAEACTLLEKAGASVKDGLVRVGRDMVDHALTLAPSELTLTPRNPERAVRLGGDWLTTAAVLGPPACTDLVRGRRQGSMSDFEDFLRLTQFFNIVQMNGWPVEPLDVEVKVRHLDAARAMLTLTDKVPYVFCQSRQRIHDVLTLCAMARGETLDAFAARPGVFSIINTNTPLVYDTPMATGVMDMARYGQPTLITPFVMAGGSTPATIAAAMALTCAEVLFGVVLAQLVRPGAPVIMGVASKNVDMRTGSPAYGMADMLKCTIIGGQMARHYDLPLRSSNFSGSNVPDFAAGYESANAVSSALSAGVNLLMHATGWVESGICASFEKFVLDCEIVQSMAHLIDPVVVDDDTLAFDEIAEVGPGGHFFGSQRTIDTVESAFYRPLISITQNYGAWVDGGAKDAAQRATGVWQEALRTYEQPTLEASRLEAMEAFIAKRREAGGAPLD
jgi:trimethylamine--corrinoid protein Co-methyltransferase